MRDSDPRTSSDADQAVSRDRIDKLVARIDARRRYTLWTIIIAAALGCALLTFMNVSRTLAYGRILKDIVIQASSIDREFKRTLARDALTGRSLSDAAHRAETKMGALHDRLMNSWTPRSYTGKDTALQYALVAHQRLYGAIRFNCNSDYNVWLDVLDSQREAKTAYSSVDRTLVPGVLAVPALTKSDTALCTKMLSRLKDMKRSVHGVRDYCRAVDGWIERYNVERKGLQDALRILRSQNPAAYESYQAVSRSVRNREKLKQDLNNISVPLEFGSVHSQFQAAIELSSQYALLTDRRAYAIYCNNPADSAQYQRQASPVGTAATRAIDRALDQYAAIRSREDFDPMKIALNRPVTLPPPVPTAVGPATQPGRTRDTRHRRQVDRTPQAGQRRPPSNQETEEPPVPPPPPG